MKNNMPTRMLIIIPMITITGILYAINAIDLINYFTICAFIVILQSMLIDKEKNAYCTKDEEVKE